MQQSRFSLENAASASRSVIYRNSTQQRRLGGFSNRRVEQNLDLGAAVRK
jgi:hypothetical protein